MDSDSDYITSYSVDERIAEAIELSKKAKEELNREIDVRRKESKKAKEELNREIDVRRKESLEQYYNENCNDETSIFNQKGLRFVEFGHEKVKFTFRKFLRYRRSYWVLRRDTFPANYKVRIYDLFYKKDPSFSVDDEKLIPVLYNIYKILVDWSKEHQEFRHKRYEQYKAGVDIDLHSEEEELFLTPDEIRDRHEKRDRILQRMLPPNSD
ncbi:hypothetical protein QE152_g6047 [Popillia japonica]|uniref:Uncharacterized protein n=1 Tax=Popillia japonica TaxID=7064 RepID=A0AAW1MK06_POPJA